MGSVRWASTARASNVNALAMAHSRNVHALGYMFLDISNDDNVCNALRSLSPSDLQAFRVASDLRGIARRRY